MAKKKEKKVRTWCNKMTEGCEGAGDHYCKVNGEYIAECQHGGECGKPAVLECWNTHDEEWKPICKKHSVECKKRGHTTRPILLQVEAGTKRVFEGKLMALGVSGKSSWFVNHGGIYDSTEDFFGWAVGKGVRITVEVIK